MIGGFCFPEPCGPGAWSVIHQLTNGRHETKLELLPDEGIAIQVASAMNLQIDAKLQQLIRDGQL